MLNAGHVYRILFENEKQIFPLAMNIANQPEKCEQQNPQQQSKHWPTLLASEIDGDQEYGLH